MSTTAIFIKERNVSRCIAQSLDLLIFMEIYEAHRKIVSQIKNKKLDKRAIESTLSFKYVRNYEAVFESFPQSVLQLVYLLRKRTRSNILILSILQSIISMVNCILNNDYTMMQNNKWRKYKQRFPPTIQFVKHALFRFSEVVYRIGLLSLFWTVCGGLPFVVLLCAEMSSGFALMVYAKQRNIISIANEDIILQTITLMVHVPSESMWNGIRNPWWHALGFGGQIHDVFSAVLFFLFNFVCCLGIAAFLSAWFPMIVHRNIDITQTNQPNFRIGVSFMELMIVIIWAFVGERRVFLLSAYHGLYTFITSVVTFMIFCQYTLLYPEVELPLGVKVRSKWGYAFSNELGELQKIKVPLKGDSNDIGNKCCGKSRDIKKSDNSNFWDEECKENSGATAAVFALAKGNYDIVEWLENQGAILHKSIGKDDAKNLLEIDEDD